MDRLLPLVAGQTPAPEHNTMIATLKAAGFAVIRSDDCDTILLELVRLRRLEAAVKTAAKVDYAFQHVLDGLGS